MVGKPRYATALKDGGVLRLGCQVSEREGAGGPSGRVSHRRLATWTATASSGGTT
jgi:hypothetical protein